PKAAVKSVKAILARTRQLREFPESGAIAEVDDHRFLVEGHYKIYYRRNDQEVFIVAVFDTRQNPSSLKLPT
ncbi:MAG: type II toxin-antitoxin system RelE/ParE family toxin, partial [Cyclobacteriaceae bacterium]